MRRFDHGMYTNSWVLNTTTQRSASADLRQGFSDWERGRAEADRFVSAELLANSVGLSVEKLPGEFSFLRIRQTANGALVEPGDLLVAISAGCLHEGDSHRLPLLAHRTGRSSG